MTLDANQILALAPDPASAKAGSQLSAAHHWSNLGKSDVALWGECQGSGKTPYKTQVDLNGPAFKCTCPSRKFPCKHGLGLYLLKAAEPALFKDSTEPQWVSDWLESRQARQERKTDTAAAAGTQDPALAAAQARKCEEKREDKVDAGMRELQTWLHDLAREGLASVRSRGQGPWDAIAARMADAQAAPLSRRLRRAGGLLYQSALREADSLVANELASISGTPLAPGAGPGRGVEHSLESRGCRDRQRPRCAVRHAGESEGRPGRVGAARGALARRHPRILPVQRGAGDAEGCAGPPGAAADAVRARDAGRGRA